jgi:Nucleotidyltransferase
MPGAPDPTYIRARRALLDVLEALHAYGRAVILVGAQAVYLHTGEGDLAVAPYTADGDLALDPAVLADSPKLDGVMRAAGFERSPNPDLIGTWISRDLVPIDLLVPEAVGGPGRRAARLGAHGDRMARKARGLEAVLVDNQLMEIAALDKDDSRRIEVLVAGPAGLLVAKLHKVGERQGNPRRQDFKDALDIYRLLQAAPTADLVDRMRGLLDAEISGPVTREALSLLEVLFGAPQAAGSQMAGRAVELIDDPQLVAASVATLASDLLGALKRRDP